MSQQRAGSGSGSAIDGSKAAGRAGSYSQTWETGAATGLATLVEVADWEMVAAVRVTRSLLSADAPGARTQRRRKQ